MVTGCVPSSKHCTRGVLTSDMDQRNALFLTPELWAEVFAHLEMRPDNIESNIETDWDRDDDLKHQLNQKYVHQVKLVCKHFKDIHASRSSLVQRLYVGQAFAVTSLPSLLMWLHERKSTLQIFQSTSATLLVDIVLSGLVSPDSSIKLLDVWNVSATSIPMIATLTSLGKCALVHGRDEHQTCHPWEAYRNWSIWSYKEGSRSFTTLETSLNWNAQNVSWAYKSLHQLCTVFKLPTALA